MLLHETTLSRKRTVEGDDLPSQQATKRPATLTGALLLFQGSQDAVRKPFQAHGKGPSTPLLVRPKTYHPLNDKGSPIHKPFIQPGAAATEKRSSRNANNSSKCVKLLGMTAPPRSPLSECDSKTAWAFMRPFVCVFDPAKYEETIRKIMAPFVNPDPNNTICSSRKTLGMRPPPPRCPLHDPNMPNALVLYTPPPQTMTDKLLRHSDKDKLVHVVVDPLLGNILRPHQREGVRFMYDCVTGVQIPEHNGCIMADEMGLGKTLQCITLLWTLVRQSPQCRPAVDKAIIVCPSSLVKNWSNEIDKWLKGRMSAILMDGGPQCKANLMRFLKSGGFSSHPVLIVSYETFRMHAEMLHAANDIGLVLCDEGHRLKNADNQTYRALMGLKAKRRILISGTPIQNDLLEYFSLINFVNEGLVGDAARFKRNFEQPIVRGQDACATDEERTKAQQRLNELTLIVNKCLIRRTAGLLTKYLPVKFEMIVICQLTDIQHHLYTTFINSNAVKRTILGTENGTASGGGPGAASTLGAITALKKLCNHPQLVADKLSENGSGFDGCTDTVRSQVLEEAAGGWRVMQPQMSGKVMVLDCLLAQMRANHPQDKIVLVSNYTQTLDMFERLCRKRTYKYVRLDGTMSIKKRAKVVADFNDPKSPEFIFMLSSKAGGCGLNLIGANRLIMFDPDWNPANDDQAMARVWRDGQQKPCFLYRFLAAGTIEEKIFQRQTHKRALSSTVVDQNEDQARHFSVADLRDLFKLEATRSDTHERLKCRRCVEQIQTKLPPDAADCTSDLSDWYHGWSPRGLTDDVIINVWSAVQSCISFVFHQKSANQVTPPTQPKPQNKDTNKKANYNSDDEWKENGSDDAYDDDDADEDYHN